MRSFSLFSSLNWIEFRQTHQKWHTFKFLTFQYNFVRAAATTAGADVFSSLAETTDKS